MLRWTVKCSIVVFVGKQTTLLQPTQPQNAAVFVGSQIRSASSQMGVGVKDQADGGVGDLIALSLDGNEAKELESEQQLSLSPAWTDLNFTEVLSDVLEDKVDGLPKSF